MESLERTAKRVSIVSVLVPVCVALVMIVGYAGFIWHAPILNVIGSQVISWLSQPKIGGQLPSYQSYLTSGGLLSLDFLMGLSVTCLVMPKELQKNTLLFFSISLLLGIGLIGLIAIVTVELNQLSTDTILPIAIAVIGFANIANYALFDRTILTLLVQALNFKQHSKKQRAVNLSPKKILMASPLVLFFAVVYGLVFFQATAFPVTEWDAIVYHVNVAKIWFENAPVYKVIAGPSVGIEMSYQYPPLFPAIGAGHYILAGEFNDLYLKVLAPTLSLLTLLLVFATIRLFSYKLSFLGPALLLTMPLFVMYSIWPTNYSTLMSFSTASLLFTGLGIRNKSTTCMLLSGIFAGFTALSSYYGIILVAFTILALAYYSFRTVRRQKQAKSQQKTKSPLITPLNQSSIQSVWKTVMLFFVPAILLLAVWYIFNWVTVGDPVFPLGYHYFHSKFVNPDVLTASLEQVKQNALGYWGANNDKTTLILKEIYSALFDQDLYSLSLLPAIFGFGIALKRREPVMLVFGFWMLLVMGSQLYQGWYWLRTFTLILPAAAALSAYGVTCILPKGINLKYAFKYATTWFATVRLSIYGVILTAMIFPGALLALVGMNHPTIIFGIPLNSTYNFLGSWTEIGDPQAVLQNAFLGEASAWQWLNANTEIGKHVATLDAREYYVRPGLFFYLDGSEATSLMKMSNPSDIKAFLKANGVEYVWLPGGTTRTASAYPITTQMPLFRYLGGVDFPVVKIYDSWAGPSYVYSLSSSANTSSSMTTLAFIARGYQVGNYTLVKASDVNPRLYIATQDNNSYIVQFTYNDSSYGTVDLNLQKYSGDGDVRYSEIALTNTNDWKVHSFFIRGTGYSGTALGIHAKDHDLVVKDLLVSRVQSDQSAISLSGVLLGKDNTKIVKAYDKTSRLVLVTPDASRYRLSLVYNDSSQGNVDVNVLQENGTWQKASSILTRADSGETKTYSFDLNGRTNSSIEIGLFAYKNDLPIQSVYVTKLSTLVTRNATVPLLHEPLTTNLPSVIVSGGLGDSPWAILPHSTTGRILVRTPDNGTYAIDIWYKDVGKQHVDFNLLLGNGSWQGGYSVLTRTNSNDTRIYSFDIKGTENSPVVLGIYPYDVGFVIEDVRMFKHEVVETVPGVTPGSSFSYSKVYASTYSTPSTNLIGALTQNGLQVVKAGSSNARLQIYGQENGTYTVALNYKDVGTQHVDFNLQLPDGSWHDAYSVLVRTNSNLSKIHTFDIQGGTNRTIVIGLYSYGSDYFIQYISLTKKPDAINTTIVVHAQSTLPVHTVKSVQVNLEGVANEKGSQVVKAHDESSRLILIIPDNSTYRVTLVYNDIGIQHVDFNLQRPDGTWQAAYASLTRANTNETKAFAFDVPGVANSNITFGIASYDQDFVFQNASIARIDQSVPSVTVAGTVIQDGYQVIKAHDSFNRLLVYTPVAALYRVNVFYKDIGNESGDVNVQQPYGTWVGTYPQFTRTNTNLTKVHSFDLQGRANSTVTVGLATYDQDLLIKSVNVTKLDTSKPIVRLSDVIPEGNYSMVSARGADALLSHNFDSRIFISTPGTNSMWSQVDITYLDTGHNHVAISLEQADGSWKDAYAAFDTTNTNQTKVFSFSVSGFSMSGYGSPAFANTAYDLPAYVFGVCPYYGNFTIQKVEITPTT